MFTKPSAGQAEHLTRLRHYYIAAVVLWTLVLAGLFAYAVHTAHDTTMALARKEALANFNKDQAFRFWATTHGGVYVPATPQTPPNPRLAEVPERDIITPSGRHLTLMNPAYMVRQLNEQYAELYGVKGHITSEKLMRPENAPDVWEVNALHRFEKGAKEVMSISDIDGKPYLRFMRPMYIQEGCLKCHGFQGYKVGDLRGGVSVAVQLQPYYDDERHFVLDAVGSYGFLWLVGLAGLTFGWLRLRADHLELEKVSEAIRQLNAGLEQRVNERTAEINAANQELEAFAYSVSHDLQAPLRAISGFSRAVLEDYGPQLDVDGRDYLERLDRNAIKMGQLITDMLKLSRSTRGEMHRDAVDLSGLANEIFDELREEQPERRVETVVQPALAAHGDPRLLRAVLENLLRNAWKFTGRSAAPRIEFGAAETSRGRAYFVRDNGAGFDMTYADKLFAPFKRLHGTDEYPGSGIGLAIVQRAVHRHGGEVWAEAVVGVGATFYFTLSEAKEKGDGD